MLKRLFRNVPTKREREREKGKNIKEKVQKAVNYKNFAMVLKSTIPLSF